MRYPTFNSNPLTFELFEEGSFSGLDGVFGLGHPEFLNSRLKITLAVLFAWVPLLILSALQGMAVGESRPESFLLDASFQVRFLIALPIILLVPGRVSAKLGAIVEHFLNAKLVKESERERFLSNVDSVMKLRRSRLADWLILAVVYVTSALLFRFVVPNLPPSWHTVAAEGHPRLSLAGWWFVGISEPFYEFVFYRFLYRIAIWWVFLWKTSRLDLRIDAAHPDGAGGLGFLGLTLCTFKEVAFAISATFAGGLAHIVLLTHTRVTSYKYEILAVVIITTGIFACPLLFFHRLLAKAKSFGMLKYGTLWQAQQRQFDEKWMQNPGEYPDMLAVADFSEATDLSQILERVQQIKLIPFGRKQIQPLIIAALLPFLVVMTLQFPVEDILKQILKMGLKF